MAFVNFAGSNNFYHSSGVHVYGWQVITEIKESIEATFLNFAGSDDFNHRILQRTEQSIEN